MLWTLILWSLMPSGLAKLLPQRSQMYLLLGFISTLRAWGFAGGTYSACLEPVLFLPLVTGPAYCWVLPATTDTSVVFAGGTWYAEDGEWRNKWGTKETRSWDALGPATDGFCLIRCATSSGSRTCTESWITFWMESGSFDLVFYEILGVYLFQYHTFS